MSILVKNYSASAFLSEFNLLADGKRLLNAGSSSVRYGANCVNVDVQSKEGVDLVCDIHELPGSLGEFDAIICNAVLQYCGNPEQVAREFRRVLKPGGYLFVDAPWMQPYCRDTPDRFRFSEDALRQIFAEFRILRIGPSIRPGSAFVMLGVHIASNLTRNRYLNFGLTMAVRTILYPLRWLRGVNEHETAGAFYLVCQKVESASPASI